MSEVELKILLAIEHSNNNECDFPTLVRISNLNEKKIKYYLHKLTFVRNYLFWIGDMNPGVPDRYRLKREGREFLAKGGYIRTNV